MKVSFSNRALGEMRRIDIAWRKRASLPDLFLDELARTVDFIESTGVMGAAYNAQAKHAVHRLLMKKSEYHLYCRAPPAHEKE